MTGRDWVSAIGQDLRFGARTLRRSPVFASVAVLSIALGVGANTAVFGVIHALMLERLPVPSPRELVVVQRLDVNGNRLESFTRGEFDALRDVLGARVARFQRARV